MKYLGGCGWKVILGIPAHPTTSIIIMMISFHEQNWHCASRLSVVPFQEYPPSEEAMARCLRAFVAVLADSSGEQRAQLFVRDFVLARLATVDLNGVWEIQVRCVPYVLTEAV